MRLINKAFDLLRELVEYVNSNEIPQSNIVNILVHKDKFYLLYYGK